MKVLELRDESGGEPVELHPQITVIRGGDPLRRAWLVESLGRLCGPDPVGAAGLLDVHGLRFDLTDRTRSLLGLDAPIGTVVQASDLPGYDGDLSNAIAARDAAQLRHRRQSERLDDLRGRLADVVAARDRAVEELAAIGRGEGPAREAIAAAEAERSRIEFELQAARDERGRLEAALAAAVVDRDDLRNEHEKAKARVATARESHQRSIDDAVAAAAALEESRTASPTSPHPAASLVTARERLAAAQRAVADLDPDQEVSPLARQIDELERHRVHLVQRRAALGDETEASPVAVALDQLTGPASGGRPVVAALALADSWRDLHQQIDALDTGLSAEERDAEERVRAAQRAVQEADAQFNQPVLTPEQIRKVEAAHTAVLEAQDRAEGRFGRGRAIRKLDELRGEERRVLERLGFATYADYMMSTSSRGVSSANRAVADAVRARLMNAQIELDAIPGAGERARRRIELLQRKEEIAPKIADLLGYEPTGPETEDELRNLRDVPDESGQDLTGLAQALGDAGIDLGSAEHERDDLMLLARAYLAEEHAVADDRRAVDEAIGPLEDVLRDLRARRDRGETDVVDVSAPPPRARPDAQPSDAADHDEARHEAAWAELVEARAEVEATEAAVARRDEAADALSRLEQALEAAARDEQAAAAAVAAGESEVDDGVERRIEAASAAVDQAEADLARARAAEADIGRRFTERSSASGRESLEAEVQERLAALEAELSTAAGAEQAAAADLVASDAEREAAERRVDELEAAREAVDEDELVEAFDWGLLARLAAVRSAGVAGAAPLVLDDPFAAIPDGRLAGVLDRLSQMATAAQVVVVSDRDEVARWAGATAGDRVAVVTL